ncbi:MAG: VacB/RNase II family 3'-5' exoribonuclease, partial [Okeania sp. SIO2H7]|nr:VacB/RNase II family 3'-5' exoribonuclease [Okeania sp. SIO2H7]
CRGLSVNLGKATIPIFPETISFDRLALLPERDRLALSIAIVIDNKGQIVEFEIEPSVICVNYQLTYEELEAMFDSEEPDESIHPDAEELHPFIQEIFAVSNALRNARLRRGAFELNLPEQISYYDEEGDLGAIVSPSISPGRAMVAELTVVANQVIASHLQALGVPAIYRVQNGPEPTEVQEFVKLANNMGAQLYLETPEEIQPADFQAFVEEFSNLKAEKIMTYLLEDSLKSASYSTTAKPHFGLALLHGYTHCTSPLSRYADLLVLRVLHTVFDLGRDRRSSRAKEGVELGHSSCHGKINWNVLPPEVQHDLETELASVVVLMNERENIVRDAEEDLEGLKKTALMKERTGDNFPGLITGVQSYGFFVEIEIPTNEKSPPTVRVEGLVHVSSLKDDWYEYRSRQQTLVGRKNRNQYRLGDRVEVQVKSVDYYRQQIDLVAISGGSVVVDEEFSSTPTYRY